MRRGTTTATIRVSGVRAKQLQWLAEWHKVNFADMFEKLILTEFKRLGFDEGVTFTADAKPEITVQPFLIDEKRIILVFSDSLLSTAFTTSEAADLANQFREAPRMKSGGLWRKTEIGNRFVRFKRRGRGIVLSFDTSELSLAPSVMVSLGKAIDWAIRRAKTLRERDALPGDMPRPDDPETLDFKLWRAFQA